MTTSTNTPSKTSRKGFLAAAGLAVGSLLTLRWGSRALSTGEEGTALAKGTSEPVHSVKLPFKIEADPRVVARRDQV